MRPRAAVAETDERDRLRALDAREAGLEARAVRVEADAELTEERLEREARRLEELEERLRQKESERATYVAQVQRALRRSDDARLGVV